MDSNEICARAKLLADTARDLASGDIELARLLLNEAKHIATMRVVEHQKTHVSRYNNVYGL